MASSRIETPDSAPPEAPAERTRMPDRPDVFVSYSRRDKAFAVDWLVAALSGRDKDIWIDAEDIPPAADWRETVLDGIAKSSAFVFVLSPDSLRSTVCAEELERARSLSKRIVPVLWRDVGAEDVPEALQRPNWILLRETDDSEAGFAKLIEALETDLEWRKAHTRIAVRAEEWVRESRDKSFLLRGSDLKAAEEWLGQQGAHEESATPDQAEYVVRSRAAANRRQRTTLAAVATALAVAIVLAIFALIQRHQAVEQARVATSRELAATSQGLVGRDPELAVLLAREASLKKPTQQAEDALRESLQRWPERRAIDTGAPVQTAQYSPDGRLILTGGGIAARVYDAASGQLLRRLPGVGGTVKSARFSADGGRALVVTQDGVTVADPRSGRVSARLRREDQPITSARFAAHGPTAIAAEDRGARAFDTRTGRVTASIGELGDLTGNDARLTPDGRFAVTFGGYAEAQVWRVADTRKVAELRHRSPIVDLNLSPDGRLAAVATEDDKTTIWTIPGGRRVATLSELTGGGTPTFSANGRFLFTASSFGTIWDTRARRKAGDIHQDAEVATSAFSRDGRLLATGDNGGDVRVFDVPSGRLLNRLIGHDGPITDVSFSRDGRLILTGSDDGSVRVWASPESRRLNLREGTEHVNAAALSPDGLSAATASEDGATRIWNASSGSLKATLDGRGAGVIALAWRRDGRRLAGGDRSGRTRIWDVGTRRLVATLRSREGRVLSVALSPDGRYAATAGESTIALWDARSGRQLERAPAPEVRDVRFALGGARLVVGLATGVGLLDTQSGQAVRIFKDETAPNVSQDGRRISTATPAGVVVRAATDGGELAKLGNGGAGAFTEFGPDDRTLTAVGADGSAYAWDVRSRRMLFQLPAPSVYSMTIGPGDVFAAAGQKDGLVHVFELASGDQVVTLGSGRAGAVRDVGFVRGGRAVLARHSSGAAWIYPCDACRSHAQLLQLAHERAARPLTAEERRRYLHNGGG